MISRLFSHLYFICLLYNSNAYDCDTVVNLWKAFGKTSFIGQDQSILELDSKNNTACCEIAGVTCNASSVVKM